MDRYGVVSVADMYDLCGMTCNYTDNKYGWKSLARADISRVRDGYMIKLPKARTDLRRIHGRSKRDYFKN